MNVLANYAGGLDVTFVSSDDGVAEKAGISESDIVVGLQGRPLLTIPELDAAMQEAVRADGQGRRLAFNLRSCGSAKRFGSMFHYLRLLLLC